MFCTNCGEKVPEDMKFCLKCGTKLEVNEKSESAEVLAAPRGFSSMICKNCGENIPEDMKFCLKCGTKIEVNERFESAEVLVAPRGFSSKKNIMIIILAGILVLGLGAGITTIAVTNSPSYKVSHGLELAERYLSERNYRQAIIEFNNVIEIEPMNAVVTEENTYMETFLMVEGSEDETGVAAGEVINSLMGTGVNDVTLIVKKDWNNTDEYADTVATAATDYNGRYSIELPLGNYTVIVSKDGYLTSSFNIIVQSGATGNQNGTISPEVSGDEFLITLTWGENPNDLDSHVEGTLSNGSHFHVFFQQPVQYDGDIRACSHKKSVKNHGKHDGSKKNNIKFIITSEDFSRACSHKTWQKPRNTI